MKHQPSDPTSDLAGNPCIECGACCAHFRVSFYCGELAGGSGDTADNSAGGKVPVELTTKLNDVMVCMKGTETGQSRCVALAGGLGQAGIRCTIYPQRPSPCREFSSWLDDGTPNPDCQRLRLKIGLPPLPANATTAFMQALNNLRNLTLKREK